MATPIFVGDLLMTESICNDPTIQQTAVLRRFWKVSSIILPGVVTFGDVALALGTRSGVRYKALLYNGASFRGTRCRRLLPANTDAWEVSLASAGIGTAGAGNLPSQVCGLVRLKTAHLGKQGEGRQYAPFPSDTDNLAGVPTASYVTRLNALGNAVSAQLIAVGGTGGQMALDGIIGDAPAFFRQYTITDFLAATAWATQRRRGAFGRFNVPPF